MDKEIRIDRNGEYGGLTDAQFEALLADKKQARATRYGLFGLLGILTIVAVTVVVIVLAVNGVFNG